jgi:hypothetical protein
MLPKEDKIYAGSRCEPKIRRLFHASKEVQLALYSPFVGLDCLQLLVHMHGSLLSFDFNTSSTRAPPVVRELERSVGVEDVHTVKNIDLRETTT